MEEPHSEQADELLINAAVRDRVQREIKESELQDADIAARTGLSPSQVGRMRRGEADNLTVKSLLRLSRAFGKPPSFWLDGETVPGQRGGDADEADPLERNGIQAVLLRGTADLDAQAQREIVRFVDTVRRLKGMDEIGESTDE